MAERPTHVHVRVRRAFMYGGKAQPVGAVLQLPATLAAEVIASNKAERAAPPAPSVPEPKSADSAAKAASKGV